MNLNEEPFFFNCDTYRLFGVLHLPENPNPAHGFVFCHPFAEEKLWTHRVYVAFARELAKRGFAVLRFDHYGHGDSDGIFENATIKAYLKDIQCAINELIDKVPSIDSINLFGYRWGATLAVLTAEGENDIGLIILWDPIVNGDRYMQEILRINLTTQMAVFGKVTTNRNELVNSMREGKTVNIDGYELNFELFSQASSISLDNTKMFQGNVLVVQTSTSKDKPLKREYSALANSYIQCELAVAQEMPFWREIKESYFVAEDLTAKTISWLERYDV